VETTCPKCRGPISFDSVDPSRVPTGYVSARLEGHVCLVPACWVGDDGRLWVPASLVAPSQLHRGITFIAEHSGRVVALKDLAVLQAIDVRMKQALQARPLASYVTCDLEFASPKLDPKR